VLGKGVKVGTKLKEKPKGKLRSLAYPTVTLYERVCSGAWPSFAVVT